LAITNPPCSAVSLRYLSYLLQFRSVIDTGIVQACQHSEPMHGRVIDDLKYGKIHLRHVFRCYV